METDQEDLQFLGIGGIAAESQKILLARRNIFAKISLSLILPLSLIFLAHVSISDRIFAKIDLNTKALEHTPSNTRRADALVDRLASEYAAYALFKSLYLVLVLVLSLLATSAVVYAVACLYTAKDVTFHKILTVVPKVWKRLLITFLWSFSFLFLYHFLSVFVLILAILVLGKERAGVFILVLFLPVYLAGLVYVSVVWHLASVISVLEDRYGLTAMKKSKELVKGKTGVVCVIFLIFHLGFVGIEILFRDLVVRGVEYGGLVRVGVGFGLLSVMGLVVLEALVVQSVVYFVCKSVHHESIDKSSLADHLEVYLGEYVPLKASDIQLEHFRV